MALGGADLATGKEGSQTLCLPLISPYGVLWCASQQSSTRQHNKSLISGTIGAFRLKKK